jgi:S-disulfanyl-L-cysteine oxidoreductase SoxD
MFNCLENQYRTSEVKYKTFGRRGRKSYAEDAKEDGEQRNTKKLKIEIQVLYKCRETLDALMLWLSKTFLYSFGIFFFAFSAQLLRPLRPAVLSSVVAALLTLPTLTPAQSKFDGIGRTATPAEVKAWDIDVRPDFKGLPTGQGSVAQGEKLWEAQCASCHGSFGESNEVFTPLAGYTSAKDVQTGKVASLQLGGAAPTRTSMMKVSQLSTLWDYINRAMPWTAPKSLKPDDVYALTAYLLNLGEVVPADFVLSDKNMADTQKRLPNRAGKTTAHGLWPGKELGGTLRPDVQGSTCMVNCTTEPKVASLIPDYAREAHGNLAEQSRALGAVRGAVTVRAGPGVKPNQAPGQSNIAQAAPKSEANTAAGAGGIPNAEVMPILQKYACLACHAVDSKLVGPSFKEVAAKQGARPDAQAYLAGKVKAGSVGVYGQIPMPAQSISPEEAQLVSRWLLQGGKP